MSAFKQSERQAADGQVNVRRVPDGLAIMVTTNGREQAIVCSEYNASRVFAFLALLLGIPLPKEVGKAIKLGPPLEAGFGFDPPTKRGEP